MSNHRYLYEDEEEEQQEYSFFPTIERQGRMHVRNDEIEMSSPSKSNANPYARARSPRRNHFDENEYRNSIYMHQKEKESLPEAPNDAVLFDENLQKENKKSKRQDRISRIMEDPKVRRQMRKMKVYRPYFLWIVTGLQFVMVIVSMIVNQNLTGSLIETQPFNFMIGPSAITLIRLGARFVPCMKASTSLDGKEFQCPAKLSQNGDGLCTINDICNIPFGHVPDQWWRFIVPIFLHGGVLHFIFNAIFQIQTGFQLEKDFGWWRMGMIYMLSGTFGFIFGAAFANESLPSIGGSGALFGLVGCLVLDLFFNWKIILHPYRELFKLFLTVLISFCFGLIPGIDNFSHIGGFIMGVLSGFLFMPSIHFGKWDKWRKRVLMIISVPLIIVFYAGLLLAFYKNNANQLCPWCKYLGCLPIGGLCNLQ